MKKTYKASNNDTGRTIYKYVMIMMQDVPLSLIEKIFRNKDVKVNGKRVDKNYIVQENDVIDVFGVESNKTRTDIKIPHTNKQDFTVIYEDDFILIVDKKNGLVVHGENYCLDAQIIKYLDYRGGDSFVPSHIGRIDKETSGIMVYAKTYGALRQLKEKIELFDKLYLFKSSLNKSLTTNYKLWHNEELKKEEVHKYGKDSQTEFIVTKDLQVAKLITGRKHQIRASLEELRAPILGDTKYGGRPADRMYLHAWKIVFHGLDGELEYLNGKEFVAPIKW